MEEQENIQPPSTNNLPRIGITVGDINGIGLEVILKSLEDERMLSFCTPVLYGSNKVVFYHKNIVKMGELNAHQPRSGEDIREGQINIVNCWQDNVRITLGQVSEEGGRCAMQALEQATEDLRLGYLDALVTAPIHKKAMQMAGFGHVGHTEYLTEKMGATQSLMFLVSEEFRVGLVTNHLPIAKVASTLTEALIYDKIMLMHNTLRIDFGINRPKIAVLGLNPHAGDDGAIGQEENELIIPAMERAKEAGCMVLGPYAADGFFRSGNYLKFDGILAMYHDQGLIPFKSLAQTAGVNYTAGLPVVRTSPDHGTGFDIAGRNVANHESFLEALFMSMDILRNRADYAEMTANPLEHRFVDNGEDEELFDEEAHNQKRRRPAPNKQGRHPERNRRPEGPPREREQQPKGKKQAPQGKGPKPVRNEEEGQHQDSESSEAPTTHAENTHTQDSE